MKRNPGTAAMLITADARGAAESQTPELFQVVAGTETAYPAPAALRVIEQLSHQIPPGGDIEDIRRAYVQSRKSLLALPETVDSTFQVFPRSGDGPPVKIIRPKGSAANKKMPAILYLHGGGWTVGTFEVYEPLCRQLANATDRVVIWVKYRLAPEHPFPAAFDDTRNALRWVHDNHGWLGIDPTRIGIAGDSAGGNLAAAVCLAEEYYRSKYRPEFQMLLYPCLDMGACLPSHHDFAEGYLLTHDLYKWYRQNYVANHFKPLQWRLSPLFAPNVENLPPAVILYAGFDPLRDEAIVYADRLRKSKVRTETLHFPDMIHGFMTMGGAIPTATVAVKRVADAIKQVLAIDPSSHAMKSSTVQ